MKKNTTWNSLNSFTESQSYVVKSFTATQVSSRKIHKMLKHEWKAIIFPESITSTEIEAHRNRNIEGWNLYYFEVILYYIHNAEFKILYSALRASWLFITWNSNWRFEMKWWSALSTKLAIFEWAIFYHIWICWPFSSSSSSTQWPFLHSQFPSSS